MSNFQFHPMKLYIQDIYRAEATDQKYIFKIFDMTFKRLDIHGIVTSIYNTSDKSVNLEITDPSGSIQVYFEKDLCNDNISEKSYRDILRGFARAAKYDDENSSCMSKMLDAIIDKRENILKMEIGDYISLMGHIFVDDLTQIRMIKAFQCQMTTPKYDIIWLEELKYLYEKFYLWKKVNDLRQS